MQNLGQVRRTTQNRRRLKSIEISTKKPCNHWNCKAFELVVPRGVEPTVKR